MDKESAQHVYQGSPGFKRVAGNTAWNLMGMCAPMLVALFAIPVLIRGLGDERFGALTLVWMLVGYLSIFDLGLGRALTKMMATKLGAHEYDDIPSLFWTATLTMLALGFALGGLLAGISPWLVGVLRVSEGMRAEVLRSFYVVACGLPVVVTITGMVGVLEAYQRFRLINTIRLFTGAYTFLGPVCVLPFTNNLVVVVAVLILGRTIECLVYFTVGLRNMHGAEGRPKFAAAWLVPLLTFGGWMTISNLAVPLMMQVDRFIIGSLISVSIVTYYATPSEVVVKLLIFPRALVSVLFPTIAASFDLHRKETEILFARCVKYLLTAMFPVVLVLVIIAPEGLTLWLGLAFGERSATVMRWLTGGIFVLSMAYIPYSLLQGIGRPDLCAKIHMLELPLYVGLSWMMTRQWGIVGAAQAWGIRAVIDCLLMYGVSLRFVHDSRRAILLALATLTACLAALALCVWPALFWTRCLLGVFVLSGFLVYAWFILFNTDERAFVLNLMKGGSPCPRR